jgi:hypothetical protein
MREVLGARPFRLPITSIAAVQVGHVDLGRLVIPRKEKAVTRPMLWSA